MGQPNTFLATESGLSWPFGAKENCLGLFTRSWDENHMVKISEQDGAGRDLMCSYPCFRRMVLNLTVALALNVAVILTYPCILH